MELNDRSAAREYIKLVNALHSSNFVSLFNTSLHFTNIVSLDDVSRRNYLCVHVLSYEYKMFFWVRIDYLDHLSQKICRMREVQNPPLFPEFFSIYIYIYIYIYYYMDAACIRILWTSEWNVSRVNKIVCTRQPCYKKFIIYTFVLFLSTTTTTTNIKKTLTAEKGDMSVERSNNPEHYVLPELNRVKNAIEKLYYMSRAIFTY